MGKNYENEEGDSNDPIPITDSVISLLEEMNLKDANFKSIPKTQEKHVKIVTPKKYAQYHNRSYALNIKSFLLAATSGLDSQSTEAPLRIGVPFRINSRLFEGYGMLRLRSTQGAEEYFKGEHLKHRHQGRQMRSSFIVTGRFKEDIPFTQVLTGQEFCHPIKVPGLVLGRALLQVFKLLAPLLKINVTRNSGNYMFSPLAQTVQTMHISTKPTELELNTVVEEKNEVIFGKPLSFVERKKRLGNEKELSKYTFKKEHYYTFDFYDDKLELTTFELNAVGKFNLVAYLLGQPIRLLSRIDGEHNEYLWNIELWHEAQIEIAK